MRVIQFGASWCAPCKMMHKVIDGLCAEHQDWNVEYHDVEECVEETEHYSIMNVPTLMCVDKAGAVVWTYNGAPTDKKKIEDCLNNAFRHVKDIDAFPQYNRGYKPLEQE